MTHMQKRSSGAPGLLFRAGFHEEDRNFGFVAYLRDGSSMDDVGEQAMAVGGHGDQVALFLTAYPEDLFGGFAHGMAQVDLEPFSTKLLLNFFQVGPVMSDLF